MSQNYCKSKLDNTQKGVAFTTDSENSASGKYYISLAGLASFLLLPLLFPNSPSSLSSSSCLRLNSQGC